MKKFLSILLAAMLVFSMGTLAFAADEAYEAETTVAAAEETTVAVAEDGVKGGDFTALEEKIAEKGLDTTDMASLLKSALKSIKEDIANITIEEILSLPADIMDDVVTFIFSALKTLGVDVDAFYEKLSTSKIINWFVNTFYKGTALTPTEIPQTGSTASVAVFATLSVAAAAAFVSFKKKEA